MFKTYANSRYVLARFETSPAGHQCTLQFCLNPNVDENENQFFYLFVEQMDISCV